MRHLLLSGRVGKHSIRIQCVSGLQVEKGTPTGPLIAGSNKGCCEEQTTGLELTYSCLDMYVGNHTFSGLICAVHSGISGQHGHTWVSREAAFPLLLL